MAPLPSFENHLPRRVITGRGASQSLVHAIEAFITKVGTPSRCGGNPPFDGPESARSYRNGRHAHVSNRSLRRRMNTKLRSESWWNNPLIDSIPN
jgi:hypothetical protein